MFQGSFVALITPFRDGEVDEQAFQSLVEWHYPGRGRTVWCRAELRVNHRP